MGKERANQVQEAQRISYRINPRRNTPRHILIKLSKIKCKEKILKAAREKQQIAYKRIPIRLTAVLSAETLQARREWQDIFKVMKGKNLQPRLLFPVRISFRFFFVLTFGFIYLFIYLFIYGCVGSSFLCEGFL